MRRILVQALWVLLICGCVNRVNVLKPTGENASLTLAEGATHHGELWSVSDSVLVLGIWDRVLEVPSAQVTRVLVEDYSLRRERTRAMIFPLVVYTAGAVTGVVGTITAPWFAGVPWGWIGLALFSGAMVPATFHSFGTGDPKTDFRGPLEPKDIAALRLYCRYPQGLTEEQLEQLRAPNR